MARFERQINVELSAEDRDDANQVLGAALAAAMDAAALQEAKGTGWSARFGIGDFEQITE